MKRLIEQSLRNENFIEPLISIIVPIYNTEKYLNQCIDSIINQSFRNIEVILVDDGSTDNSPLICDEYAKNDNRIKVIHKKNGGLSDARNYGIDSANGKYILFIDSDDFIEVNSLEEINKTINTNPEVDLIFLEATKYFDNRNLYIPLGDGYEKEKIENKTKVEVLQHLASLPKYPASAWAKLIKRTLILENNLYFIKGITNEDLEWAVRLFISANTFNYCKEDYYFYRQNREGSITNTFSSVKFECFMDTIKRWSNISEGDMEYLYRYQIFSFMAYEYNILLYLYAKLDSINRKKYKNDIKSYAWLMNYRKDKKNVMIRIIYNFLGLTITSKLLRIYLKIR